MKKLFIIMLIAVAMSSCTTRIMDFTVISSKNVDMSDMGTFKRTTVRQEGVDKTHIILIFPTGTPNGKEAVDRAIEKVPGGVALVDGVLSQGFWWIPYIYGQTWYEVEGTVLVDPKLETLR